jgi:hypothetical protein
MSFSDAFVHTHLDAITVSAPWMALGLASSPTPNDNGTGFVEANYGGYLRRNVAANIPAASARQRISTTDVTYPIPASDTTPAAALVRYIAFFSASSGGTCFGVWRLANDVDLSIGTTPRIRAGSIVLRYPAGVL